MPLKHSHETWLILLLALMTVLTGFVIGLLPPLTVSVWPWLGAFALSVAYPLALYPLLKDRRAEYEFRALHFFPALMLLVWMALQLLADYFPRLTSVLSWYSFGFALPAVMAGLVLLALFSLQVIRQWILRLTVLLLLIPVVLFGAFAGEWFSWDTRLTAAVWPEAWQDKDAIIAMESGKSSVPPASESSDPDEREWREALQQMQERSESIKNGEQTGGVIASAAVSAATSSSMLEVDGAFNGALVSMGIIPASASQSSARPIIASGSNSSVPPRLPTSGGPWELLVPVLLASYTSAVHLRTKRRV